MIDFRCGICDGDPDRRRAVDRFIAQNRSSAAVERECKALGMAVKRETVHRHRQNCLGAKTKPPEIVRLAAKASASDSKMDFAMLVKAEAVRRMNAGELTVSVNEGLAAQAILDKRDERKKDRDLITNLGRLLLGGGSAPPITVIDGSVTEEEGEIPLLTG